MSNTIKKVLIVVAAAVFATAFILISGSRYKNDNAPPPEAPAAAGGDSFAVLDKIANDPCNGERPVSPVKMDAVTLEGENARIKTKYGDMVVRFFPDTAPKTVENFKKLAAKGFYNGLIFHRVIKGFMIQGGDPEGTGMGGPGYTIPDEFNARPHKRGALSMAHSAAPNSAGSQFFIVHQDSPHLNGGYTVFGELVK
jgi:cyclophilin family peptidyl-prolyl cis-trans isomerase